MFEHYQMAMIPRSKIIVEDRAREEMGELDILLDSITGEAGLIHPIAVVDTGDGSYRLLAGGRRLAAIDTNVEGEDLEVPCHIYPPDTTESVMLEIELAENLQRKDMSFVETTALTKRIHEMYIEKYGKAQTGTGVGHSLEDTANILNVSTATVAKDIKMAEAIEAVPELGEAKNKAEATLLLSKLEEQMVVEEMAKRMKDKAAEDPESKLSILGGRYQLGNAFDADEPDQYYDLIECDPPYGIDFKKKRRSESEGGKMFYNEVPSTEYQEFVTKMARKNWRVLKHEGWLINWYSPDPWAELMYQALVNVGFTLSRIPAIWFKRKGGISSPDTRLASDVEFFYYARKGDARIQKQGHSTIFTHTAPSDRIHPTERPVELIKEILETFTVPTAKVWVPFLGSGNTILAADELGMEASGWDLSEQYRDAYLARLGELI